MILLSSLDVGQLVRVTSLDPWGLEDPDYYREVFEDHATGTYVKIWGETYAEHKRLGISRDYPIIVNSVFVGFDFGFYDELVASALVDLICDNEGRCRGYITRAGTPLESIDTEQFDGFVGQMIAASRRSGLIHTDFCYNNLILIDGKISLIDYDTVLSDARYLDLEYEAEMGGLREHVFESYRKFIIEEARRLRSISCGDSRGQKRA